MALTPQEKIDRFRVGLLSGRIEKRKKIAILKKLVELKGEPRVREVLREAAEAPVNASFVSFVVRAYGYLDDPSAADDLEPYLVSTDRAVVSSAFKAMASLDRERAVERGALIVRSDAADEIRFGAARVLGERLREEARPVVMRMAFARKSGERQAALAVLRYMPAEDALPVVLEMMRRERKPRMFASLAKVLPRLLTADRNEELVEFRQELAAKLAHVDGALSSLAQEVERSMDGRSPLALTGTEEPGFSEMAVRPITVAEVESSGARATRREVPLAVEPAEGPRGRVTKREPTVPEPPPADAAEPGALPWMVAERRKKERRTHDKTPALAAPASFRRRGLILAAVLAVVVSGALAYLSREPVLPPSRRRPVDKLESPLGKLGAKLHVTGVLVDADRDHNILTVKDESERFYSVWYKDQTVGHFTKGKPIVIDGLLREIRSDQFYTVEGVTVVQP